MAGRAWTRVSGPGVLHLKRTPSYTAHGRQPWHTRRPLLAAGRRPAIVRAPKPEGSGRDALGQRYILPSAVSVVGGVVFWLWHSAVEAGVLHSQLPPSH